jgi:ribosomal protein L4
MSETKAKEAKAIISAIAKGTSNESLATKRKNAALVVLAERNVETELSFRNFGNVEVTQAKDINPVDLLTYKYVVVIDAPNAIELLEKRVSIAPTKSK